MLNTPEEWHSHSRGLSREVLERKVNLIIEDFGADEELNKHVKLYYKLLIDYMMRRSHTVAVHAKHAKPVYTGY